MPKVKSVAVNRSTRSRANKRKRTQSTPESVETQVGSQPLQTTQVSSLPQPLQTTQVSTLPQPGQTTQVLALPQPLQPTQTAPHELQVPTISDVSPGITSTTATVTSNTDNAGNSTQSTLLNLSCINSFEAPIPRAIGSTQFSLGYYVEASIRQKIISGKFVNLATLLVRDPNKTQVSSTLAIDPNGQLIAQPKQMYKIQTIDRWTDAFIIYMSIYTAAHPEKVQQFLKYMHDIRLGAQRSQGWLTYDEQYRLRASINTTQDWGVVDAELWMLYMTPTTSQIQNLRGGQPQKCFDYNYKGSCHKLNCPYLHRCLKCNNVHPSNTCFVNSATARDSSFQPFRFPSSRQSQTHQSNTAFTTKPNTFPTKFNRYGKQQTTAVPGKYPNYN
ncbi:uncharacterized protein LOC134278511 [Saccostrea cucullata]|uniref:uncharacterized protein LOC134229653 n=1 Tax=Saccostrea cuccullata TaxID=36930 RepID=UPI002ED3CE2C